MDLEELKTRQLDNQHLLSPADPISVVRDLCGVQAQFLSNSLHAVRIRCEGSLCTDQLVKSWTIRGTIHVFAMEDLPLFLHQDRRHFLRPCDTLEADEWITKERKQYFADRIIEGITSGITTRDDLKSLCFTQGMTDEECESVFNPWGGTIRALCETGRICYKVQEKKEFRLCPPFEPMTRDAAQLELARRYFTHYGPATVRDAAYFFSVPQAQVKSWLSQLPVGTASCCGKTYFFIENQAHFSKSMPDCLFLAGFDPLMLGYQKTESLYLPQAHIRKIFSLSGIVMPSILLHGRVVGKWKKKGTALTCTLFDPIPSVEKNCIESKALIQWSDVKRVEFLNE